MLGGILLVKRDDSQIILPIVIYVALTVTILFLSLKTQTPGTSVGFLTSI